ncbi:transposase family protein [Prevotella sp. PTAC]|uniref:ISAon1 family transposase N-terminal region protein n=1 Tax=Prevotella sp. PTAC TaxID=2736295 RepID=UPI0020A69E70|nr:transposase family protein [Prevotella sp. PTAC]NPD54254.1 transposase family protein [Prevotella sp. PTAC]
MPSNRNLHKLLRVIFPEVLMEYFEISGWYDDSVKIEVWLDEKHHMERSDYKSGTVISHGFTDEKVIQDFPLRGKPVYLHVRRRRRYDKATGETFSYTYDDLTAEGTKPTPESVAFFKEED